MGKYPMPTEAELKEERDFFAKFHKPLRLDDAEYVTIQNCNIGRVEVTTATKSLTIKDCDFWGGSSTASVPIKSITTEPKESTNMEIFAVIGIITCIVVMGLVVAAAICLGNRLYHALARLYDALLSIPGKLDDLIAKGKSHD